MFAAKRNLNNSKLSSTISLKVTMLDLQLSFNKIGLKDK